MGINQDMHNRLVLRNSLVLLLTLCLAFASQLIDRPDEKSHNDNDERQSAVTENYKTLLRAKRATRRPGFFKTLFQVIYEQYADTKNTFRNVSNMLNDNFLPENAPVTQAPTPSSDPNVTTTAAPFKLKRSEFNKIIQRNLRGLIRLYNIELQDALKQSDKNYAEFKKNASKEISKFL